MSDRGKITSFYNESHTLSCGDGQCGCAIDEAKKLSQSRIGSLVFSYKSDPCLMEDNKFFAVLIFQDTHTTDSGKYTLHFEDESGDQLSYYFNISTS